MIEYICQEVRTGNGGYLEPVKELIRCRDCKHNNGTCCTWHSGKDYEWLVDPEDYCSVGEREEE